MWCQVAQNYSCLFNFFPTFFSFKLPIQCFINKCYFFISFIFFLPLGFIFFPLIFCQLLHYVYISLFFVLFPLPFLFSCYFLLSILSFAPLNPLFNPHHRLLICAAGSSTLLYQTIDPTVYYTSLSFQ